MSEVMLKKYGGNGLREKSRLDPFGETTLYAEEIIEPVTQKMGLGEQPRSRSPSETTLYAEEITGRVMQKMGFGGN